MLVRLSLANVLSVPLSLANVLSVTGVEKQGDSAAVALSVSALGRSLGR